MCYAVILNVYVSTIYTYVYAYTTAVELFELDELSAGMDSLRDTNYACRLYELLLLERMEL